MNSQKWLAWAGLAAAIAIAPLAANAQVSRGDRYSGAPWASRSPVLAQHGMAATEQPLASQIAIDILKKGGSAVDAAIAANAAHRTHAAGPERHRRRSASRSSGIRRRSSSTAITAPAASAKGRDLAKMQAEVKAAYEEGGHAAEAPYPARRFAARSPCPAPWMRWFALHDKFGKLPMADDLAPAIDYAQNGFPVTQLVASYWKGNMAAFEKNKALIEETRQRATRPTSSTATRRPKAKSSAIPISPARCR